MKILFIGDIVGRPGRQCVVKLVPEIREEHAIDLVVANGENAAGGLGATTETLKELFAAGVHVVTLGNHTWRKREFVKTITCMDHVVRPANYPVGVPGRGSTVYQLPNGRKVGVLNLVGRVFMEAFACPFEVGLVEVERLRREAHVVLVDFHAEATSEKVALGWFLDGQCAAVLGTHTHVQTADERVLPKGTAYISDVGMTGPWDSVIGVERDRVIKKFRTGIPTEFRVATERPGLAGVVVDVDEDSGQARSIVRVARLLES